MTTILIPTDFSNNALMAVDFAVNKLLEDSGKLILLTVYQIPHGGTSGLFYLIDEMQKQAKSDMEDFSKKLESRYPQKNLTIETKISQGDMAEQCSIIAKELKADCLVMGTKGSSGLREVLIGSNTVQMMKSLDRPLYVIPENFKDKEIEKVIISYDGKDFDEKNVAPIRFFAEKYNLPISLLHVRTGDESPLQDWTQMKNYFKGIKVDVHESHGEDFEEGLKKGTDGEKAILVMIRHKQSFWERFFNRSDSRKAVMHAELPMLIIPEK
jgi:nucleotide-binding universal stress UspA family protein